MLYDKLAEYFGDGDREQEQYVREAERRMNVEKQLEAYNAIIEKRAKRFGFPDISILSTFLSATTAKGGTYKYMWAVCDDCKAQYDYRFITCPKCHEAGKRSSGHKVRVSDTAPGREVIRWNMTSLEPDGKMKLCVECAHRNQGYCGWFGNPDHQCPQSDYQYCECKQCCAYHKKANRHDTK